MITAILSWLGNALCITAFVYAIMYAISPTIRKETWGTVYKTLFSWWVPGTWAWIQTKMPKKKPAFDGDAAMELSRLIAAHGEDHEEVKQFVEANPALAFLVNFSKATKPAPEAEQQVEPDSEESALESEPAISLGNQDKVDPADDPDSEDGKDA